jgi:glycosyltransferase involved in cell wall biosynthesis
MKIAAIEYHPTSTKGGSEKAFFEVLVGLKNLGHQIIIFYIKDGDYIVEYEKIGIKHIKIPKTEINYLNINNWFKFYKAAKIINNTRPDMIYINQLSDSVTAALCKLLRKVKIVCHIRVPKQGNSRMFNFTGKLIDNFMCVNYLIKAQYLPYFKEIKLNIINDGIKIPSNAPLNQREIQVSKATFLGRLSPEKGILNLLDTWLILKNKYNLEIQLDITGPSDSLKEKKHRQKIIDSISAKKLEHLVNIKSPISNSFEYFQGYDFSVFPSVIDESFGRTLPESILAGTPVFARNVGIAKEILSPLNTIFVYETESELADKIFSYYNLKSNYDFKKLQSHILLNYDIDKNIFLVEKILKQTVYPLS